MKYHALGTETDSTMEYSLHDTEAQTCSNAGTSLFGASTNTDTSLVGVSTNTDTSLVSVCANTDTSVGSVCENTDSSLISVSTSTVARTCHGARADTSQKTNNSDVIPQQRHGSESRHSFHKSDCRHHLTWELDVRCFAHEVDVRCVRREVDVRCVVVGDDAVGKTSMLMGYATNRYPTQHVPPVFDNYAGTVKVAGRVLHLEIIDTLHENQSPSVRLSEYPGTDIFVVCFSVVRPETLRHVEDIWLPEIRAHAPETPFILVGTQADLREVDQICAMLKERGLDPVSWANGSAAARRMGAACYVECSPDMEKKLRKIINSAIASVLKLRDPSLAAHGSKCTIL